MKRTAGGTKMNRQVNRDFADDISTYISINELLTVRLEDEANAENYHSRIDDIDNGKLIVAWPTRRGMRMLAHRDEILDFSFMLDGVPHQFSGLVDEMLNASLPQLVIIMSSAVTRVQRRQNFRVKCLIPLEIVGSMQRPKENYAVPLNIKTTTCDFSASGMAFRHSNLIPEDTLVEAKLSLPDDAPTITIPCRVMYCDNPSKGQMLYRTGLQYITIAESHRARIVRFIYRKQLKGFHPA
jgi:c-di-GMP-binding flagellar brake protein YcgR